MGVVLGTCIVLPCTYFLICAIWEFVIGVQFNMVLNLLELLSGLNRVEFWLGNFGLKCEPWWEVICFLFLLLTGEAASETVA